MSKMTVILIVVGCFLSRRHKTVVYELLYQLGGYLHTSSDYESRYYLLYYCITAVSCYVTELTYIIIQVQIWLPRLWEDMHYDCLTN